MKAGICQRPPCPITGQDAAASTYFNGFYMVLVVFTPNLAVKLIRLFICLY